MLVFESEGLSLVYIHVPKTAGTTLRHILEKAIKDNFLTAKFKSIVEYQSPSNNIKTILNIPQVICDSGESCITCYNYWEVSNEVDLAHIPRSNFQDYYPPNKINSDQIDKSKYIWLTCVRNPYSRIYSAYCWHNKQNCRPSSIVDFNYFVQNKLSKIVNDYNKSFQEQQLPNAEYIHFIPMWMMISEYDGSIKMNHIIRQENFDQDIVFLMEHLNLKLPMQYKNMHCRGDLPPQPYEYMNYYEDKSKEIIETLYQKDFKLFGYAACSAATSRAG